jgi:polyisoprenoid-binding protein YceI
MHMKRQINVRTLLGLTLAAMLPLAAATLAGTHTPLAIDSARITISGTSNVHPYTASTTTVRVTRAQLAEGVSATDPWTDALKPGGITALEVAVPAATLTSPREGLDKNMHQALGVAQHPEIAFRLLRVEPGSAPDAPRAVGVLTIAGVEREVAFDITTERQGATLCVHGKLRMLMTDFGIKPPTAMLGMLKTDPKVTVTFDAVLAVPLT